MTRYLPVVILLLGGAAIAGSSGFALLRGPTSETQLASVVAPSLTEPRPSPVTIAPTAALFGAEVISTPVAAPVQPPPLRLAGLLSAEDPRKSHALIETSEGLGIFRLGDLVVAPFILGAIGESTVTISAEGERHELAFEGAGTVTPRAASAALRPAAHRTAAHRAISAPLKKPETTAEYIEYWRERARRNPGEVLAEIGLVRTDRGYGIAPDQDIGVRLAGFKSGDVITSVNGLPVGTARDDLRNIDRIIDEGLARIEFDRNGEQRVLTFPLR